MQYGFCRYALQIYYSLLLKENLPRTQERLELDFLEHHSERSLKFVDGQVFK